MRQKFHNKSSKKIDIVFRVHLWPKSVNGEAEELVAWEKKNVQSQKVLKETGITKAYFYFYLLFLKY